MKNSERKFEKLIACIDNRVDWILGDKLTAEQEEDKWLCENSFYLFVERAWPIIEGNSPFMPGWHRTCPPER